jgi:hypothetical protein
VAQLTGTAAGCAGVRRPRPSRAEAIAEIREVTEDPALLADAAAQIAARGRSWHSGDEVQLLLDAGADPDLVVDYYGRHAPKAGGFDLGRVRRRAQPGNARQPVIAPSR